MRSLRRTAGGYASVARLDETALQPSRCVIIFMNRTTYVTSPLTTRLNQRRTCHPREERGLSLCSKHLQPTASAFTYTAFKRSSVDVPRRAAKARPMSGRFHRSRLMDPGKRRVHVAGALSIPISYSLRLERSAKRRLPRRSVFACSFAVTRARRARPGTGPSWTALTLQATARHAIVRELA
jgi:hypothetical protein